MTIFEGHGQVLGGGKVSVGETVLTARHILVAVGGKPFVPDLPGREHVRISDDLFYLDTLPKRVAVVGGGYIATEFAGILHGLGCQVTQVYRGALFLRGFDQDIREFIAEQMKEQGVTLKFNADVASVEAINGEKHVNYQGGEQAVFDEVFYATGRIPKLDDLFAEGAAPAMTEGGAIKVDDGFATSVEGLYALGDVIDRVQLTPVALAEGMWLAAQLYGEHKPEAAMDYQTLPRPYSATPILARWA